MTPVPHAGYNRLVLNTKYIFLPEASRVSTCFYCMLTSFMLASTKMSLFLMPTTWACFSPKDFPSSNLMWTMWTKLSVTVKNCDNSLSFLGHGTCASCRTGGMPTEAFASIRWNLRLERGLFCVLDVWMAFKAKPQNCRVQSQLNLFFRFLQTSRDKTAKASERLYTARQAEASKS